MGGDSIQKYVIPSVETVGGAVSQIFAPGNPIGLSMMGSGIGQLAGGSQGKTGQSLGGSLGGMLGGMGGGGSLFGGGSPSAGGGFAMPGQSGAPSISQMQGQLPSFINPSDIIGVSTQQAPQGGGQGGGGFSSISSMMGPVAQYLTGSMQKSQQAPPQPSPQPMNLGQMGMPKQQQQGPQPPPVPPAGKPGGSPLPGGQQSQLSPQMIALLLGGNARA